MAIQYYKVVIRRKIDRRVMQSVELPALDEIDAVDQALQRYPEYEDNNVYSYKATAIN